MQSLIEKTNNGGHFEISNKRQNWKYDWFTPTHSGPSNPVSSGTDGIQHNEGASVEKYPFNFKTWSKTDECTWRKILEANDSMELLEDVSSGVSHDQQTNRPANGDSLTAEDIRGAVGSVDGISGFSSSDAQAQTKQEPAKPPPATVPEGNQEQNNESKNEANQDHDKEQDQDVNMDKD